MLAFLVFALAFLGTWGWLAWWTADRQVRGLQEVVNEGNTIAACLRQAVARWQKLATERLHECLQVRRTTAEAMDKAQEEVDHWKRVAADWADAAHQLTVVRGYLLGHATADTDPVVPVEAEPATDCTGD